jgi:GTP-binding protein
VLDADDRALVIADIPGLIEGAASGVGLGHDFLAHVERCRVLVHVVEVAPLDGSEPAANYASIEAELAAFSPELAALPRIVVVNKLDLVPAPPELDLPEPLFVSAATGAGLDALRRRLLHAVPPREVEAPREDDVAEFAVFRPAAGRAYEVEKVGAGNFRVTGDAVERLIARFDMENEEAQALVERRLVRMGVIAALEREGFEPGDDVEIGGIVFELDPS